MKYFILSLCLLAGSEAMAFPQSDAKIFLLGHQRGRTSCSFSADYLDKNGKLTKEGGILSGVALRIFNEIKDHYREQSGRSLDSVPYHFTVERCYRSDGDTGVFVETYADLQD